MKYKEDGSYLSVCPKDCYGVCSLSVSIEDGKVKKVAGNKSNSNSDGKLCIKGASYPKRLYHPDRITNPLLKDEVSGDFKKITWNHAYEILKTKLEYYRDEFSSESIMYLSGWGHTGVLNNYNKSFWSQFGKITTTYGSLCMAGGKLGIKTTYGDSVKHNHNSDLKNSKLIIIWGANPANTNIHRMRNIKEAVKNGAKLVVIDPRVSESMIEASIRIHPHPGTDSLLAMAIAKILIERDACDYEFIEKHVLGFEEYKDKLEAYDLDYISKITAVSLTSIYEIVDLIIENPIYSLVTGSGKSRYTNATQTERAVCLLPALTGSIGISGGGVYYSDGQQSLIKWPYIPKNAYGMKNNIHVARLGYELDKQNPMIKMLWIEKVNPLTSSPDVNSIRRAFEKIDFIVTVEHFMSDTARESNLILPGAMFSEKDDIHCVYGDSYIHLLQKLTEPLGNCKSEPEIYRELGALLGMDLTYLPPVDEDMINNILSFNNIKTSYKELSEKPYIDESYKKIAYEDLVFDTPSGKIEIYSEQISRLGYNPLPEYIELKESKHSSSDLYKKYPLHFLSSHSAYRINSQFIEMELSKKEAYPVLEISHEDSSKRLISDGDMIRVFNDRGEIYIECKVCDSVIPGTIHVYEGWSESFKASINKLTKGRITNMGDATSFHDCLVDIEKI